MTRRRLDVKRNSGLWKLICGAIYVHLAIGILVVAGVYVIGDWRLTDTSGLHLPRRLLVYAVDFWYIVVGLILLSDVVALYILYSQRQTSIRRFVVVSYLAAVPITAVIHFSAFVIISAMGSIRNAAGRTVLALADDFVDLGFIIFYLLLIAPAGLVAIAEWLRDRSAMPDACTYCAYDCAGLPLNAPCPECGRYRTSAPP